MSSLSVDESVSDSREFAVWPNDTVKLQISPEMQDFTKSVKAMEICSNSRTSLTRKFSTLKKKKILVFTFAEAVLLPESFL